MAAVSGSIQTLSPQMTCTCRVHYDHHDDHHEDHHHLHHHHYGPYQHHHVVELHIYCMYYLFPIGLDHNHHHDHAMIIFIITIKIMIMNTCC